MRGLTGCQVLESMGATEELSLSECLKFYNAPEGPAWGLKLKTYCGDVEVGWFRNIIIC